CAKSPHWGVRVTYFDDW
nr:immunoglobulin heavy chain junction region [Macaca mulatta]MOX39165.1 immunoglobulin heavy chain junction region [Macaca mulatta]MOX41289.1 immunoglobulin heavy chain junction region [Macaca mulatta]